MRVDGFDLISSGAPHEHEHEPGLLIRSQSLALNHGASCATPSGLTVKNIDHNGGTWKALLPCVSGSDASIRRFGRIAIHSRPKNICRAFHLQRKEWREIALVYMLCYSEVRETPADATVIYIGRGE